MSPQLKRTAIGGFVVALTLMLVLTAIAVAQRDARNMDAAPMTGEPEYAMQAVQPLPMPAGMINRQSQARFPNADLPSETEAMGDYPRPATVVQSKTELVQEDLAIPPTRLISQVELSTPPAPTYNTPFAGAENPLRSNPMSQAAAKEVILTSEETPLDHDADASHEVSSSPDSDLAEADDALARNSPADESKAVTADWQAAAAGNNVPVVQASGYDLPPNGSASAGPSLLPPPLPSLSPGMQLPSAKANPATSSALTPPPAFGGATATLLPPTAAPAPTASNPSLSSPAALPPGVLSAPSAPSSLSTASAPSSLSTASAPSTLSNPPAALPPPPAFGTPQTYIPVASSSSPPAPAANQQFAPATPPANSSSNGMNSSGNRFGNPATLASTARDNTDVGYPSLSSPPASDSRSANGPSSSNNNAQAPSLPSSFSSDSRSMDGSSVSLPGRSNLLSNRPGERTLDGMQAASLQIMKEVASEIQVGHPATFTILVKNTGRAAAHEVTVQDQLPQGVKLQATNPPATVSTEGRLVWNLGSLPAGGQQVLTIEAIPEAEGELGSIATVQFASQASVRTVATQPKLVVTQQADPSVLIGEIARVRITITNDGTGVAYDVKLQEDVPAGFRHPQGDYLGLTLNDLAPGQSRTVDLELEAVEPGKKSNVIRVIASNTDELVSDVPIEVVAPKLTVQADGPKLRYLDRQATYNVQIQNLGTARARNIELIAYLPKGLRFNSAGNRGEYLADQHAVIWMLEELAASGTAKTDLVLLPVEEGDYVIRFQSRADRSTTEPFEKQVRVEGQSELSFTVEDDNDPIEVNGETTYLIRLTNIGTRRDSNIQVSAELPPGATVISMSAPVEYQQRQNMIVFSPLPSLEPKGEQLIRFSVSQRDEGMQMLRVSVKSDLRPVAVVKEESTHVYSDN